VRRLHPFGNGYVFTGMNTLSLKLTTWPKRQPLVFLINSYFTPERTHALLAGVPLGVTFSFLISTPMVNEMALTLLFGVFAWKVALAPGLVICQLSRPRRVGTVR